MLETLRVNSLTGSSIVVMLDKVVTIEEAGDGESTVIHFLNGKTVQCTDDVETLQDAIRRISYTRNP